MKKRICEECLQTALYALPVSRGARAFAMGAIRFFATLKDPGPQSDAPQEKCDQCGQEKPVCFAYGSDPAERCIHCGLTENADVHTRQEGRTGHDFETQAKETTP